MIRSLGRARRNRFKLSADINLTNLIDVAFVLLIIFIITAPILQGGIELSLPDATAQPLEQADPVMVSINAQGEVFVSELRVDIAELGSTIATYRGGDENRGVVIRPDENVSAGRLVEVMDVVHQLGIPVTIAVDVRRQATGR